MKRSCADKEAPLQALETEAEEEPNLPSTPHKRKKTSPDDRPSAASSASGQQQQADSVCLIEERLPDEVLRLVLGFLPTHSIGWAARTCRRWFRCSLEHLHKNKEEQRRTKNEEEVRKTIPSRIRASKELSPQSASRPTKNASFPQLWPWKKLYLLPRGKLYAALLPLGKAAVPKVRVLRCRSPMPTDGTATGGHVPEGQEIKDRLQQLQR